MEPSWNPGETPDSLNLGGSKVLEMGDGRQRSQESGVS